MSSFLFPLGHSSALSQLSFVSSCALLPSCIPSVASGWYWSTFLFTSDYIPLCVFRLPLKHLIFGPLCLTAGCSTICATPSVSLHSCVDLPAEPLCSPPSLSLRTTHLRCTFFLCPPFTYSHTHRIASSLSPYITPFFSFFLFFLAPYSLSTSYRDCPSRGSDSLGPSPRPRLTSEEIGHPLLTPIVLLYSTISASAFRLSTHPLSGAAVMLCLRFKGRQAHRKGQFD